MQKLLYFGASYVLQTQMKTHDYRKNNQTEFQRTCSNIQSQNTFLKLHRSREYTRERKEEEEYHLVLLTQRTEILFVSS